MELSGGTQIDDALARVGELLAAEGRTYAIVVIGGAALNLLGIVERATTDIDILAFAQKTGAGTPELVEAPEPLPSPLMRAAHIVGGDLGLADGWLNAGPAAQWRSGLPPGLDQRIEWRRYAALDVGIVGRRDLVFFKLYAAADSTGRDSVHYQDLLALRPDAEELEAAAKWVGAQDFSAEFHRILDQVERHVRNDLGLDRNTPQR